MGTGQRSIEEPFADEIEEAKQTPNGWIYRIAGRFGPTKPVPSEAIVGVWRVNDRGCIVGGFIRNHRYNPERWPTCTV